MWTAGKTTKLFDSGEVAWPKGSTTTCRLRLLGSSALNEVCATHDPHGNTTAPRVVVFVEEVEVPKLMIRSGDGVKIGAYYRSGSSFPSCQVESHGVDLATAGQAAVPL